MTVPDGWSAKPIAIVRYPSGNIKNIVISGTAPKAEAGKSYWIQVSKPLDGRAKQTLAEAEVRIDHDGCFAGQQGWPLGKEAPNVADYTYEIYAMAGRLQTPTGPPIHIGTGTTNVQL
ncbi:hypothetical protein [Phytomonospora endophytica]|uniref:Uncharacterized protein n=1 Tax=Phytomonospora endophytica TaxID=714109 RepID=A0A841FZ37_9ACTN|nr:hypothetical protein [Phytomonospora endophytica]MBB6040003.1 hypothetical protein [Phytomonospora endophytica]GIG71553.1 hypothetical protein Pen01_78480 [Phytomonospora endophytica]